MLDSIMPRSVVAYRRQLGDFGQVQAEQQPQILRLSAPQDDTRVEEGSWSSGRPLGRFARMEGKWMDMYLEKNRAMRERGEVPRGWCAISELPVMPTRPVSTALIQSGVELFIGGRCNCNVQLRI